MNLDPWRTLELAPGAGEAEIKRAYRRLAKEHHPDAGGPGALPRFLAIQSAYEMLMSDRVRGSAHRSGAEYGARRGHGGTEPAGQPWSADPGRARATREAWGRARGRRRWGDQGAADGQPRGPGGHFGSTASGRSADGTEDGTGADRAANGRAGAGGNPAGRRSGSRARPRTQRIRKATPGSTTYDEAHLEPDEPGWTGSSWYGQASGTYWTINPREYADPRKHGPDYQARARRATRADGAPGGAVAGQPGPGSTSSAAGAGPGTAADTAAPGTAAAASAGSVADSPGAAGTGRDHLGGPALGLESAGAPDNAGRAAHGSRGASGPNPPTVPRPARHGAPRGPLPWLVWRIVNVPIRPASRMGLALTAWPPLGVAAVMILGELTGCARAAATCPGPAQLAAWSLVLQVAILASLVIASTLARIGAVGTLGTLIVAVPGVALLTALGASYAPDGGQAALLWLLGIAYLAGVVIGWRLLRAEESGDRGHGGTVGSPT